VIAGSEVAVGTGVAAGAHADKTSTIVSKANKKRFMNILQVFVCSQIQSLAGFG
jgi:hypothetical protein